MKLLVDTQGKTFTVTKEAGEKQDQNGRQKQYRLTGEPLWTVPVKALDQTGTARAALGRGSHLRP
jgi:hypothetical protein